MAARKPLLLLACALLSGPALSEGVLEVPPGLLSMQADPDYGAYLGSECTGCHQLDSFDGIPPLHGLGREHFILAMLEYQQRLRDNKTMQLVAARLSHEEIAALAAYFNEPE